ncbi:MAG: hypothetical protein U9N54_03155 [candidate division Zixibacteria bacterium]|nr:hypothetical protein [candidate division Zixibacteria bacterium]
MSRTYWKIGFDLKSKYQKNLLLSICIVNGLLLIPVMIFVLFLSENSIDKLDINFDTLSNKNEGDSSSSGKNAQGSNDLSYSMLLPSDFPKGYIGKVKIIREYKKPEINVSNSVTANSTNYNIPICDVSNDEISFGDGSGNFYGYGDDDFGLPGQNPYLPQPREEWDIIENGYFGDILFNRLAVARLASPKWPSKANRNDTGIVEVIFTIFKDGYISLWDDIEIIKEFPQGRDFGLSVKYAIYRRSIFKAAVKNGKPVDTKVKLVVKICQGCKSYVVSQNNVVIASTIR